MGSGANAGPSAPPASARCSSAVRRPRVPINSRKAPWTSSGGAAGDLAQLGSYFGVAPAGLLNMSPWFRQGEALFAGGFVPAPTLVKMGSRLTPEGGGDVGVPMR